MIIDVKAKETTNGGSYLVDRDEQAYKIFEGDPKRFDSLALEISTKKKITHYSFVLSFKEEHLTKDDLLNYYYQFKQKAFSNYDPKELEILAVAHFDDNKPHVHCTVLSSSQIDDRDLRLYRGYVDFPRIEAIQETINYENNLESPFDNMNLLSLTPGQKKRDWKVKKREINSYKILDDEVYEFIENQLKDPFIFSYKEFITNIENKFGKVKIIKPKELALDGNFNNSKLLKECQLVLTEHLTSEGNNLVYNSKLFDENWFKKNINYIKENIYNRDLKNIKFKLDKKDYKQQQTVLKETTLKHEEHLYKRKIGKKYLNENKNVLLYKEISNINDIRLNKTNKDDFEELVENSLSNLTKEQIKDFNNNFKISSVELKNENGVNYLKFTKNNIDFNIYNKNLVNLYNKDLIDLETTETLINKLKNFDNLKSYKQKKDFTILLEDVFYKNKISKKEDFIKLLNDIGVGFEKVGQDTKKGNFILLTDKNDNKIRVYNDIFYNFLINETDILKYKENRDIKIEDSLKNNFLNNYIRSVYVDLYKKDEKINTVKDYQLFKSDPIINTYFSFKDDIKSTNDVDELSFFTNYRKNEKVSYSKGVFAIHKTLDKRETGKNIADMYFTRGSKNIKINKNMDQEILEAFKDRLKEKKYDIKLWDQDNKLFYVNPYAQINENKEDYFSDDKIKYIAKETYKLLKEDNINNLYEYVKEFDKNSMETKKDIENFRNLILHLKEHNKNSLEAVCLTSGIDILRVGHDSIKGEYATFEFKGRKVSVYDKSIVNLIESSNSKEVLLSI